MTAPLYRPARHVPSHPPSYSLSLAAADRVDIPVRLRFCTLGASLVHVGSAQVTPSSGILFALLVRVAHSPGMSVTREQLVGELWPGHDPMRQRANLRQALYKLRSLGVRVGTGHALVTLDSAQVAPSFALERTAARFQAQVLGGDEPFGPFLPGFAVERGELAEWLELQRALVHGEVRHVLVAELRARRDAGDWGGTEAVARALLRFDPLNEEGTLHLAECTMLAGAKAEAVGILDRFLAELGELGAVAPEVRGRAQAMRRRFLEPPPRAARVREREPEERHFVGREAELAQLTLALRRARWQDGSAVLVHGAPGIGKTRLAQELSRVAAAEGFREVRLGCREGDEGRDFQLLAELVQRVLALPGALGCAPESMRRLRRQWPAPGAAPEGGVAAVPVDFVQQAATREALLDLLAAVTEERPILLVVEDVHWLDAGSWQVLQLFASASATCRLFLLATSREPAPVALRGVARSPRQSVVALAPLPPEELRRLADAVSAEYAAPLPAAVAARLLATSEGNPLFLRALIKHWADTGDAEGIPGTLMALLETRVGRLAPTSLAVLQAIVVLGPLASAERLRGAAGVGTAALLGALDELAVADCIRAVPPHHVASHDLVGQAARARLSAAGAAVLHGAVADVLWAEQRRTGEAALLPAVLEHLMASGRGAEWGALLVEAQEAVLGLGTPAPMLAQAEALAALAPAVWERPAVRGVLAQLQAQAGNYEASLRLAGDATQLSVEDVALDEATAKTLLTHLVSAQRSDITYDVSYAAEAIARLSESPKLSYGFRLEAARRGLVTAANQGARDLAERCHANILEIESAGSSQVDTRSLKMIYHASFGSLEKARTLALELAGEAPRRDFNAHEINNFDNVAYALRFCGEHTSAISLLERSYTSATILNLPRSAEFSAWQLASIYWVLGDGFSFAKWAEILKALFETTTDVVDSNYITSFLLRISIENGDQPEAKRLHELYKQSLGANTARKAWAFAAAAEMGVAMLDPNWLPDEGQIDASIGKLQAMAPFGFNDYTALLNLRALVRANRCDEAVHFAIRHVTDFRREREPLLPELRDLIRTLPGVPEFLLG